MDFPGENGNCALDPDSRFKSRAHSIMRLIAGKRIDRAESERTPGSVTTATEGGWRAPAAQRGAESSKRELGRQQGFRPRNKINYESFPLGWHERFSPFPVINWNFPRPAPLPGLLARTSEKKPAETPFTGHWCSKDSESWRKITNGHVSSFLYLLPRAEAVDSEVRRYKFKEIKIYMEFDGATYTTF